MVRIKQNLLCREHWISFFFLVENYFFENAFKIRETQDKSYPTAYSELKVLLLVA